MKDIISHVIVRHLQMSKQCCPIYGTSDLHTIQYGRSKQMDVGYYKLIVTLVDSFIKSLE